MGKKLGLGLIGLILAATVYYFAGGSAHIVEYAKQQLNSQLNALEQSGFSIKERKSGEKSDHFIISFDDPEKLSRYLNTQGAQMTKEDAEALKGLQVGVDAQYLPDRYSALSLDLYPTALPQSMQEGRGKEDKKLMTHLKQMLAKKVLLLHINFNKTLSGFKGYVKDINETIEDGEEKAYITAKNMTFKGEINADKINTFSQKVGMIALHAGEKLQVQVSGIAGGYHITGATPYDMTSQYKIAAVTLNAVPSVSIHITHIKNTIQNSVHDGLLKSTMRTQVQKIKIVQNHEEAVLDTIHLDLAVDHIDTAVLDALQKVDPKDQTRINTLTRKLFSKGITLTIPEFSVQKITDNTIVMNGFDMNGSLAIEKDFNVNSLSENPFPTLKALHIRTHLGISDTLYAQVVQDPRAMIFMMMLPPVSQPGKKIYDISYEKGKLRVNGKPFF